MTERRKHQLGSKVVLGFILAGVLVLGVSVVTYVSIRKLLVTVEKLSEPNEELSQLNGLLTDIYLLDVSKTERTADKDSVLEVALSSSKARLGWLKRNTNDSASVKTYEEIGLNIDEIMVVYAGLEEVRYILTNRTLSELALKNIEAQSKRQNQSTESNSNLDNSVQQNSRSQELNSQEAEDSQNASELRSELEVQSELMDFMRELQAATNNTTLPSPRTDSVLLAIRAVVEEIYKDEKRQQSNFIALESKLIEKNKEIYAQIQGAITAMQEDLLREYEEQTQSAYQLTFTVSIVLGFLVFLGVVGSLGFIFIILKEVNQANTYREKLEEAKKKSDQLAKAKQDFLANMSHEIRNPLHAIQGYQRALDKSELSPQQREFLEMIGFAAGTLNAIVNDILDFSKLEAGQITVEKVPFDPSTLFSSIRRLYDLKAAEQGLGFEWHIDLPEGKWILGDQLRLNQILGNLLNNSFKFTSEGSIKVYIGFKEENLILEVEDSGMGMGPEVKENLFKEFNQGDASVTRKYGGTGLGLAIVRKLVDRLNGSVDVWSEVGVGTKVTVKLPLSLVGPIQTNPVEEISYDLSGLCVLVIDDDSVALRLLKLLLESAGARVFHYSGGKAWRENFMEVPLDFAIIDIQMPEVSGLDVLKDLKSNPKYKRLPVFAMTANVFANDGQALVNQGFDGVILKPFDENSLFEQVKKVLGIHSKPKTKRRIDQISIEITPPLFDLSDIRRFCMDDEQLLREVIQDLIRSTTEDLNSLREGLVDKDYSRIAEICHQLASRLGQIKVPFSDKILVLEESMRKGNIFDHEAKLAEILPELEHLLSELQQNITQNSNAIVENEPKI